jgi:hypothetical protein
VGVSRSMWHCVKWREAQQLARAWCGDHAHGDFEYRS